MPNALNNAGLLLIHTIFDLYIIVLLIRMILLWARADFFNPITQIIVKLTNPIITPLKHFIPNLYGIECASALIVLLLEIAKFYLIMLLTFGKPHLIGLLILSIADTLKLTINIFFYAILLQAILSWVQGIHSPIGHTLTKMTSPILKPFQRMFKPISGFDISPIPAMLMLQLLLILLITPLTNYGMTML